MERVAFLLERSGERIECLINPDTFTVTRQAGLRPQATLSGVVGGRSQSDHPLLATGGGSTELHLELLFDMSKVPRAQPDDSVQTLTGPLWALAENSHTLGGTGQPPQVLFCWGKAWSLPVVVAAVAERFEQFTASGVPRRSWMTLRLLRRPDDAPSAAEPVAGDRPLPGFDQVVPEDLQVHELVGELQDDSDRTGQVERLDALAHRLYGDASLWRWIAAFNDIADPARMAPGTRLLLPPAVPEV